MQRRPLTRTAGRYFERSVSRRRHVPRVPQTSAYLYLQQTLPLSAVRRYYQQGELLNRIAADVDTLDHFSCLRAAPAGRRFCSDYDYPA